MKLRALEPEDLELLYTIENDPDMWCVGDTNVPYSHYDLKNYISGQNNDIYVDRQVRFVVTTDDDRAIGLIDLFNFSPKNMRAEMGFAIAKSEQGKGYSEEAIRLLQQYCRETLCLHQIYCIVPASNIASLTMLRNTKFINETVLKDWLRTTDGYCDAVSLQCFL